MDTEFHYYMTGIIAHAAGFTPEEAKTIASASEYTDENDDKFKVKDRATGEVYENYISQTMNILKPMNRLMRIYPVFHFLPGEPDVRSTRRRDGKMHRLNTTPDNETANTLMNEAFNVSDGTRLYRIGLATHAYADTWAHQNFVGWFDYFNNIGLDIKPDIGHADAEHHPDWPAHRWEDPRLVDGEINNTIRFLSAAERIYDLYRLNLNRENRDAHQKWDVLQQDLIEAMGTPFSGSFNAYREERYQKYLRLAPWLGEFDETDWLEAAVDKNLLEFICDRCYYWREDVDIEKTDWFLFQQSVKDHQKEAMVHLDPIFETMGIDLHRM